MEQMELPEQGTWGVDGGETATGVLARRRGPKKGVSGSYAQVASRSTMIQGAIVAYS